MKRFGCLALIAVSLVSGWFAYHAMFPARVGGVPFSQLSPQTQQERRASAQTLVKQVETIARAARSAPKSKEKSVKLFEIRASEEQLNTLLQDRLRTEKFPISDLSVGLSTGVLTLQGTAKYQGISVPATISGAISAKNGALQYEIDSLSLSGLPAPGKIRDKAQNAIKSGLQKAFAAQKNLRFESVETAPRELILRGETG